jgi:hypothetical protein
MRTLQWIGAVLLILIAGGRGMSGESKCCPPEPEGILERFHPGGGWFPYGGGLLHWWPRCCFPCCGGPDDYDRKKLPKVCWPGYPPYYIWGPPANCPPKGNGGSTCSPRH